MRTISEDVHNNIRALLAEGLSVRQIADRVNVGVTTVHRVRQKCPPVLPKRKAGRPNKLSDQNKRYCVRTITSARAETATDVAKRLDEDIEVSVSRMTVARALRKAGMGSFEKESKPRLSAKNIKARLQFAKNQKDWTVDE